MFINYLQIQSSPYPNFRKQKRAKSFTYNPPLAHTVIFQTVLITLVANKYKKFDSINSDLLGLLRIKSFHKQFNAFLLNPAPDLK